MFNISEHLDNYFSRKWPKPLYAIKLEYELIEDGLVYDVEEYHLEVFFSTTEGAMNFKDTIEQNDMFRLFISSSSKKISIQKICFCYLYRKVLKRFRLNKKYFRRLMCGVYRYMQHFYIKWSERD